MNAGNKAAAAKKVKTALDALAKVGIHLREQLDWK